MSYSNFQNVIDEFKNLNTTTGLITDDKITEWISQEDAYINGRIGLIYDTPVTGTESLKVLKKISIGLTAQRIARILETKTNAVKGEQNIPKDLIQEAKDDLQLIVERKLLLSDADYISSDQGVKSYTSDNSVSRTFDTTTQQW